MKKALLVPLLLACTIGGTYAGPYFYDTPFSDIDMGSYDREGDWYAPAVSSMYNKGIIKGYADSTYRPGVAVNRAELATIMDRMYTELQMPFTKEWTKYTNDHYEVWYPVLKNTKVVAATDQCGTYLDVQVDSTMPVTCHNYDTQDIESLIDSIGNQFRDNGSRKEMRETITVNGVEALHVTVTTMQDPSWVSETVYIPSKDSNKYYELSNGAVLDPNFKYFYMSFEEKA